VHVSLSPKSLMDRLQVVAPLGISQMIEKDYDLIQQTRLFLTSLPKSTTVHFSSTTTSTPYEEELSTAQGEAHKRAKEASANPGDYVTVRGVTSVCQVTVRRAGSLVVGGYQALVRENLYSQAMQDQIIKSEKWSETTFHLVEWQAVGKAFNKLGHA
jgi:hypothetical protein